MSSQGTSVMHNLVIIVFETNNAIFRYKTSDRRIIGATVGWGAVSSKSDPFFGSYESFLGCLGVSMTYPISSLLLDIFNMNYPTAATTTMVMGHLLARLAEKMEVSITGNLKTFCIGFSLGGQLCGFAGKNYRFEVQFFEAYQP